MIRVRGFPKATFVDRPQALAYQALTNSLMADTVVLFTQFLYDTKSSIAALAFRMNGLDLHIQYGIGKAS
jgi:hypothetical protein